ncbi:hypothetical protein ARMGADRAFT_876170, partial [Armillaria gallica]
ADVVLTLLSGTSWLGDSGATRHIVKNRLYFSDYPQKDCKACIQAKHHAEPFPHEAERDYAEIGKMTFLDLWGPA